MSATEDASSNLHAPHARRSMVLALAAFAGILGGALAAAAWAPRVLPPDLARYEARVPWRGAAPAANEWPRPAAAGERAVRAGSDEAAELHVTGPNAHAVGALAALFERARVSGADAAQQRRERLRTVALSELVTGPHLPLSAQAECAALLRARARVLRTLAGQAEPPGADFEYQAPFLRSEVEIGDAALAGDPVALVTAFDRASELERTWLMREARRTPVLDNRSLEVRWSAEQAAAADRLSELSTQIEAPLSPAQRELVDVVTPERVLEREAKTPDPSGAILAAVPASPPDVQPLASLQALIALAGGLLGAALLTGIAALATRSRRGRRTHAAREPIERPAGTSPETSAWLQLVSGVRAPLVASAVMEHAARGLEQRERVLVIDGGRRHRLHRAFSAESRLGLRDCLDHGLPVLGLVQHGGVPGLLFLASGDIRRRPVWTQLDRLLEDIRPHFGRVILVLDADAPHEVGGMLAGRWMDAWWADAGRDLNPTALKLSDRMGIRFAAMQLEPSDEAPLEVLKGRVRELANQRLWARLKSEASPEAVTPELPEIMLQPPMVLDSDLQVRERLRFLAWMRRVQAESPRETREPAGRP